MRVECRVGSKPALNSRFYDRLSGHSVKGHSQPLERMAIAEECGCSQQLAASSGAFAGSVPNLAAEKNYKVRVGD